MKAEHYFLAIVGIAGLIGIRFLENKIFYDPFIQFFHEATPSSVLPEFSWLKLLASHVFRFILNLFFSSLIIQVIFRNWKWTVQAVVLMALVFTLALLIYSYCLYTQLSVGQLFTFYIRRFVIQPLILLLIIPIFYYRKHLLQEKNDLN